MITVVTHIFAVSSEHRAIISNVNVAVNVTIYAIAYIKRNALKCFCAKMIAKHKWRFETIKRMIKEA